MTGAGFSFLIVITLLKQKFFSFNASAISSYSSSLLNISLKHFTTPILNEFIKERLNII